VAQTKVFLKGFSGGELSTEIYGRVDDAKFQSGAAKVRNMLVKPHGPVVSRPGTQFIRHAKNSPGVSAAIRDARVITFGYSAEQQICIELGAGYFRFHALGATLLATTTQYVASQVVTFNSGTEEATWASNHNLATNDPIQFTTTGTLPTAAGGDIAPGVTYYAIVTGLTTTQLARTPGGAPINLTGVGAGTHTGHRPYALGDAVTNAGAGYVCISAHINHTPPNSTYWYPLTSLGGNVFIYELPNSYQYADLFDITYTQSADVMTLAHRNYPASELRRLSSTNWSFTAAALTAIAAPTGLSVASFIGDVVKISQMTPTPGVAGTEAAFLLHTDVGWLVGDEVYIDGLTGTGGFTLDTIAGPGTTTSYPFTGPVGGPLSGYAVVEKYQGLPNPQVWLRTTDGYQLQVHAASSYTNDSGRIRNVSLSAALSQTYVVTAVGANNEESVASSPVTATNNLFVSGSTNTLTWNAYSGAVRFKIYKQVNGIYGYIGQTDGSVLTFIDDNIGPDPGLTPPISDTSLTGTNYPGTVGYFEGRRWLASTNTQPQDIWGSRSGTEGNFTYSIPVQDSDRIYRRLNMREVSTIRHIVPLQHLILLTSGVELRVSPANSDALSPTDFNSRPQSYIGASTVRPQIVGHEVVFVAWQTSHVHALNFDWRSQSYDTGDLTLRATHLFNGFTLKDSAYGRSPFPVLWFVRSDGTLLSLTHVPGEQVDAWARHDTAASGVFESCCTVNEGGESRLYVVVYRVINSVAVRYIERMGIQNYTATNNCFFVDAGLLFDGTNATGVTITIPSSGYTYPANYPIASGTVVNVSAAGGPVFGVRAITVTTGTPALFTLAAHAFATGDAVSLAGNGSAGTGTAPTGLSFGVAYYIIYVSGSTFRLASSVANAYAGVALACSTAGTSVGVAGDIGDQLCDSTGTYRATIVAVTDWQTATAQLAQALPFPLSGTQWAWARRKIVLLDHLLGQTVSILSEGVVQTQQTVVTTSQGTGIVLSSPSIHVNVGLPFNAELATLPFTLGDTAQGQGRTKSLSRIWVRILLSGGFSYSPTGSNDYIASQYDNAGLHSGDVLLNVEGNVSDYGQLFIRYSDPLPLMVVGVTLEASLGS
jgi:hypothetical protein